MVCWGIKVSSTILYKNNDTTFDLMYGSFYRVLCECVDSHISTKAKVAEYGKNNKKVLKVVYVVENMS